MDYCNWQRVQIKSICSLFTTLWPWKRMSLRLVENLSILSAKFQGQNLIKNEPKSQNPPNIFSCLFVFRKLQEIRGTIQEKRMLCSAHKMQLHTANNFIVETWLVLYSFITSFAMASWHFMGFSLIFKEKNSKQATLNSSNYMRIIRNRTRVAYEAHLLWKCAQKSCIMH